MKECKLGDRFTVIVRCDISSQIKSDRDFISRYCVNVAVIQSFAKLLIMDLLMVLRI